MTTIDPNVVDAHLALGLRERAVDRGDEDRFYEQVLATIALLPQRRSVRPWPALFGRRTILVLAVAALVGLLAVAAVVGGLVRPPTPPVPGFWTTTGRMINPHEAHTGTLLRDGRVLVAGAGPTRVDPAAAELYDPSTGYWTATGRMNEGRAQFTATLLRDGRVLVAGGGEGGSDNPRLSTAELYDPETGTWTATGRMTQARGGHTATLLRDGRVLVAGGAYGAAELYDPGTGTWTATGNMVGDHFYNAATLLPDGTVLVAGESAEVYDPSAGTWTATGPMIHPHSDVGATLLPVLPNGTVLVAGGAATSAELYDPRTGTWSATGSMIMARAQLAVTLLPDGTVLVTGGVASPGPAVASAELYDPRTGTWAATANMNAARRLHTATLLPGGTVLVVGGIGDVIDDARASGSAELYHPGSVPSVVPQPQLPSAEPSAKLPSDAPTPLPASSGLIAYAKFGPLAAHSPGCPTGARSLFDPTDPGCSRIWVSNTDGTGAHELVPDHLGYQTPLEWSRDGTRLLFEDAAGLWLVDPSGTIVQSFPFEDLCPTGCDTTGGYAFSPDGTTIAFARPPTTTAGESVIALVDVATGQVTEVASTASEGNDAPHWSPDGTRLTFARQPGGPAGATLYMVNADGSNLHQYVPPDLYAIEPRWSPDGSLIGFTSVGRPDLVAGEIYVVQPDGTGLRRLTTGGVSIRPEWTGDGRIVYSRALGDAEAPTGYELWSMDADGANQAKLPVEDVVQLTAAQCVVCAWVRDPDSEILRTEFLTNALWQPTR